MEERKLTEKQKRFIDFYIETGNATEAARRAGYRGNNLDRIGYENLRKLEDFVSVKIAAKDNERIAGQDEILQYYSSVFRDELTEDVVLVVKGKVQIVKKRVSTKDRTEAAKELAKRYGLDKPEQTTTGDVEIVLVRE